MILTAQIFYYFKYITKVDNNVKCDQVGSSDKTCTCLFSDVSPQKSALLDLKLEMLDQFKYKQ